METWGYTAMGYGMDIHGGDSWDGDISYGTGQGHA